MDKLSVTLLIFFFSFGLTAQDFNSQRIQPYKGVPYFWQYKNKPVLLIGGSSNDNLFQSLNMVEELDLINSVGGNYVRNTMSSRDEGNLYPFWRASERFNLDKFNPDYWKRFDFFLKLAEERDIIVQIEIWAFHDFAQNWVTNPWNPANNNTFTEENTYLKIGDYGKVKEAKNDFFFSVPKLNNDNLLLEYQRKFVDKLLSVSLKYGNVLYCITNEIFSQYSPEWGWYWSDYLKTKASEAGVGIEVTEMYQNEDVTDQQHLASIDHPEIYSYIELSQNSTADNQKHWTQLQRVRTMVAGHPRPINNVKIYGGQLGLWTDGPNNGIERFWRNIIGGAASARFHRPPSGIGISERAQFHIKSASMLAKEYDFFTSFPDVNSSLLLEREPDEAYLASNLKGDVVVYFPDGGQVILDFTDFTGKYKLKWLNIEGANWIREKEIEGGGIIELESPFMGNMIALLSKQ